jgi:Rps23 Pro-64 3,4-dihydroxylase Tpa1-like proline 4-hydroxylase
MLAENSDMSLIRTLDVSTLAREYRESRPFPFIKIESLLDPAFAAEVAASYPIFDEATKAGYVFKSVNEHLKVQVTDESKFPEPVRRLHQALSNPEFLEQLSAVTGIPKLLADNSLAGGGMHQTGPRGRLDVHVDFNRLERSGWHRRLNILVYFNREWKREWGGNLELWDDQVKVCYHSIEPVLNRCILFETSERSYHGVEPVACPAHLTRRSFAAYYYTEEAPPWWDGSSHSTVFRARPTERVKGLVFMPAERLRNAVKRSLYAVKQAVKATLGR